MDPIPYLRCPRHSSGEEKKTGLYWRLRWCTSLNELLQYFIIVISTLKTLLDRHKTYIGLLYT